VTKAPIEYPYIVEQALKHAQTAHDQTFYQYCSQGLLELGVYDIEEWLGIDVYVKMCRDQAFMANRFRDCYDNIIMEMCKNTVVGADRDLFLFAILKFVAQDVFKRVSLNRQATNETNKN
jgi:hypothetical protein